MTNEAAARRPPLTRGIVSRLAATRAFRVTPTDATTVTKTYGTLRDVLFADTSNLHTAVRRDLGYSRTVVDRSAGSWNKLAAK